MVSGKVLKEQRLAKSIITVAAAVDWNGKLMMPEIHLRGVVTS